MGSEATIVASYSAHRNADVSQWHRPFRARALRVAGKAKGFYKGTIPIDRIGSRNPFPSTLQPNELRRSSEVVRWSLTAAEEAIQHADVKASEVATIFASSGGETAILHQICIALNQQERAISPTLFHHFGS